MPGRATGRVDVCVADAIRLNDNIPMEGLGGAGTQKNMVAAPGRRRVLKGLNDERSRDR